ncbi:MAG: apolipoprotein N-acyltransferase [Alistipes sp.]|nr:apolipoprotein N-acyltransferase [Alistipes sp.]
MIQLKENISTKHRLLLSLLSALLLSAGWSGVCGFTVLIGLVPLLIISHSYGPSWREFWKMAGWGTLTFIIWHLATVWWVWNAAAIGTIAATIVGSWWALLPLMLFHFISKRMAKGIAYTLFVTAWIACEYIYIQAPAMSFPWLTLGNCFAFDSWAVQWYEYTGVLGGSLWVLVSNIIIFNALQKGTRGSWVMALCKVACPIIFSLILYAINSPTSDRYLSDQQVEISVVQPNVDCYTKFDSSAELQQKNLMNLLSEVPATSKFVLMPETSLATTVNERFIAATRIIQGFSNYLKNQKRQTMIVAGTQSLVPYGTRRKSDTNRRSRDGIYYDIFNSSIGVTSDPTQIPIHHKGKLVIGVETLPAWFRTSGLFEVDLGGTAGQLGIGEGALPFEFEGTKIAPAICYEGLYGNFMGEFVRNGAQILGVVSNDGWWGDTPGYRWLFALCRLRAIEHRRDIARSANTGISGFINSRGDVLDSLGWDKEGLLTAQIRTNDSLTLYTRYGDYIGRISLYIALLSLLYTVAFMSKKRFYLD